MLADAFGAEEAGGLFHWLSGLSFVETQPEGIAPHEIAREATHADLAWRNPVRLRELNHDARRHYIGRYRDGTATERMAALRDLVFLHRLNPIMRAFFEFRAIGQVDAERRRRHPGTDRRALRGELRRDRSLLDDASAHSFWAIAARAYLSPAPFAISISDASIQTMSPPNSAVAEAMTLIAIDGPRAGKPRPSIVLCGELSIASAVDRYPIETYVLWMTTRVFLGLSSPSTLQRPGTTYAHVDISSSGAVAGGSGRAARAAVRHLPLSFAKGIERVSDRLWQREIDAG